MARCWHCAHPVPPSARFCRACGANQSSAPVVAPPRVSSRAEWYRADQVLASPPLRLGALGAALAFIGAFTPWATYGVQFWGFQVGYVGIESPQAWLTALGAVVAALLLFRPGSGTAALGIGVVTGIWTAIFAISVLSQGGSPSIGPLLTLVGAGLLAYSGYTDSLLRR